MINIKHYNGQAGNYKRFFVVHYLLNQITTVQQANWPRNENKKYRHSASRL